MKLIGLTVLISLLAFGVAQANVVSVIYTHEKTTNDGKYKICFYKKLATNLNEREKTYKVTIPSNQFCQMRMNIEVSEY